MSAHRISNCRLKAAFHDTDTDILADIITRIVARMSVSWNAGLNKLFLPNDTTQTNPNSIQSTPDFVLLSGLQHKLLSWNYSVRCIAHVLYGYALRHGFLISRSCLAVSSFRVSAQCYECVVAVIGYLNV